MTGKRNRGGQSATAVFEELTRVLGRSPDPEVWAYLIEKRYVNEILLGEGTMKGLVQEYRRLERLRNGGKKQLPQKVEKREVPPDQRNIALSEILAILAAERPDVKEFRNRFLGNKLLSWDEAVSWIEEQERAQRPTIYAEIPIPEGLELSPLESTDEQDKALELIIAQIAETLLKGSRPRPLSLSYKFLRYARPHNPFSFSAYISLGGPLGELHRLSETLSKEYGWTPERATIFVLTGITPMLPRGEITTSRKDIPALNSITVKFLVGVPVCEVAQVYANARRRLLGPGRRDPAITQEWRAQLAVFAAANNDGRSWRQAMEVWNQQNSDHRYSNPSTFARDVRQAYEKITGTRLVWGKEKNEGYGA